MASPIETMLERLLTTLMGKMGMTPDYVREQAMAMQRTAAQARDLLNSIKVKVDDVDERLRRIEQHLGIGQFDVGGHNGRQVAAVSSGTGTDGNAAMDDAD